MDVNVIKILIVENDLFVSEQMANYLQELDYEVCNTVDSGEEALKVMEETTPDLVLMDIELDGKLDGVETASIIQENQCIPIIYLTKLDDARTLGRVKETMPAAYLTKPFRNHEVRNAIEIAIYKSNGGNLTNTEQDVHVSIEMDIKDPYADSLRVMNDRLFYRKTASKLKRLFISNIIYLESSRNKTIAQTLKGDFILPANLKQAVSQLKDTHIIRINRQYAVNIDFIDEINSLELVLDYPIENEDNTNDQGNKLRKTLPLGKEYRKDLDARLNIIAGCDYK